MSRDLWLSPKRGSTDDLKGDQRVSGSYLEKRITDDLKGDQKVSG